MSRPFKIGYLQRGGREPEIQTFSGLISSSSAARQLVRSCEWLCAEKICRNINISRIIGFSWFCYSIFIWLTKIHCFCVLTASEADPANLFCARKRPKNDFSEISSKFLSNPLEQVWWNLPKSCQICQFSKPKLGKFNKFGKCQYQKCKNVNMLPTVAKFC